MLSRLKRTLTGEKAPTPEPKKPPTNENEHPPKPKRTHYTQNETEIIKGLVDEGYSTREIATKMNRTVSGIRGLKRRLDLTQKIQAEIPTLTSRRDALAEEILDLRINLSLEGARLEALKKETAEYGELKKRIEYYRAHENQIKRELQTLIRNEGDAIAISKIFQLLKR